MRLFKQKYNVCAGCNVLFKPPEHYEKRWDMWCTNCRKPIMEKDLKRDAVISWAGENWERLYDMMKEERAKSYSSFMAAQQKSGLYQSDLANAQNQLGSDIYRFFGGK